MGTLQVRMDEKELAGLDELADDRRLSRSEMARVIIGEGMRTVRMTAALEHYLAQHFTLARAAEYAGVTIHEMSTAAAARGIPYFRLTPDEIEDELRDHSDWYE